MSWLTEAAPVASAGFAALAAGASWRSVRVSERSWRASIEPDLHMQVIADEANNRMNVVVYNAGGGLAKGVALMLVGGGSRSVGYLREGLVRPGDELLVRSELPATIGDDLECLLVYRDRGESPWAVTRRGEKHRLRKRRLGKETTLKQIWTTIHPDKPYPPFNSAKWTVELVESGH